MSNVILNARGESARLKQEAQYDPRLIMALKILEPLLQQQGLSLYCMKCHALGLPDGVRGFSEIDNYVLDCGCTHRTFTARGKVTVQ